MNEKVASREQILSRVQKFLAQADHENTSKTEAATYRAKAEKLMAQYRIEESEAIERGEAPSLVPGERTMDVSDYQSPFAMFYLELAGYVLTHCGAKGVWNYRSGDEGLVRTLEMVGYESDLMFAEMLYTSIRLAFAANLEPQYNAAQSDTDNVYRMRNAGMTRDEIAEAMGWLSGDNPKGLKLTPSAAADKASKLYGTACREKGSEPRLLGRSTNMKVYKEQYAESFVTELYWRLRDARNGVDMERGSLVLANRADKVQEAFYEKYPHLRPSTLPSLPAEPAKAETEAQRRRREARWAREQAEADRKRNSLGGQAGAHAGRQAAKSVDLQGVKPTKRLA